VLATPLARPSLARQLVASGTKSGSVGWKPSRASVVQASPVRSTPVMNGVCRVTSLIRYAHATFCHMRACERCS
jgi:hypothetical protein